MASFTVVVKGGKRYHYYPKGRDGGGKAQYIQVRPGTSGGGQRPVSSAPALMSPSAPAPAPAPAAPAAPAAPSVPLINPFLRPADLQSIADFQFQTANSLADIDKGLADLGTQTSYDRQQTDRGAKQASANATEDAIGRGLFRSSIKDATLFDIEGQRARQQQLYTDRLNNASMDAERRKATIRAAQDALNRNMAEQAVENAREVSRQQQVAVPGPPPAAAPAAPAAPKFRPVPGRDKAGNPGVWHVYPDGHKVFVRK